MTRRLSINVARMNEDGEVISRSGRTRPDEYWVAGVWVGAVLAWVSYPTTYRTCEAARHAAREAKAALRGGVGGAEALSPGELLREELDARGWTPAGLSAMLGCDEGVVREIIIGKRGISPEVARDLAAALGTSPELWLNLEAAYQRALLGSAAEVSDG